MKKGFTLIELVITLVVLAIMLTFFVNQVSVPELKRKMADSIIGHVVALDTALMNVDMQLKVESPNLNFPIPNPNDPRDLLCVVRPYLWKNLPGYNTVAPYLLDNYLDVRADFVRLFRTFPPSVTVSGGRIRRICLRVSDAEVRQYVVAGNSNFVINGNNVCYNLNAGAGYRYVVRNYNCPW
ncbi:MAG: hypothetical protein DSY42_01100 [Aquifex sp.]|nr:MAG: hypothetical protein DSY42_01100 [Aquifex sp.]